MAALHGPLPDALDVTIHHCPVPGVSVTPGAMEHVPVPLAQPACAFVYVVRMRSGDLRDLHSFPARRSSDLFHVKVGVAVVMLPDGATSVAGPGGATTLFTVTATAA